MSANLNQVKNWPELAQQANWSAVQLAKLCGVSESALRRHFHRMTGKSPKKWLTEERQNHARQLFQEHHSTKEAATALHYSHASNLSRAFHKYWRVTPKMEIAKTNAKMTGNDSFLTGNDSSSRSQPADDPCKNDRHDTNS